MSKSKNVVKKLTTILFTLVAVFTIGLTNVNAETTTADVIDYGSLETAMSDKTTDVVRLTENITIRDDLDTIFYIYKSKTLDLNGHTITVPRARQIQFWYYEDADIKIINSSSSRSAKFKTNHTGVTDYFILHGAILKDGVKVNFEIDGVDFESDSNYITAVNMESGNKYESLIFKNSNIKGFYQLIWSDRAKKVYFESITQTSAGTERHENFLSLDTNLTVNDVIDANSVIEYYPSSGVKATADGTTTLSSINTKYGPITVKKKEVQTLDATTEDELIAAVNQINNSKDTIIKLGADIKLTKFLGFNVLGNVTLDLAGNTLDVSEHNLTFYYGYKDVNNYNFRSNLTIKDSGFGNSGKIVGVGHNGRVRLSTNDMAEELKNLPKNYGFTIDGGTYAVTGTGSWDDFIFDIFSDTEPKEQNITLNVNVKKGIFEVGKSDGAIFYLPSSDKTNMKANFNFETLMVKGQGVKLGTNILGEKRINEVIPTDTKVYYTDANGVIELEDKATLVMNVKTGTSTSQPQYIKLAKKTGLSVDNVTLPNVTFGYTDGPEATINITNIGAAELKITNVTVSGNEKFEIIGSTKPTIGIGAINNDFKIKAKSGLSAGTYTPTIIVTDENGGTYTATVTLKVDPKQLTGLGIDLASTWVYKETKTPTLNGVESLTPDDYAITYSKRDNSEKYDNKMPILVGKYKATLSIKNSNYTASEASVDFEITPITTEVKVKSYDETFTYDGTEHTKNAYDVLWANNASPITDKKLPNGDLVTAVITGKVRDVKDTAVENNTIGEITITNAEGVDVTSCYSSIVRAAGKLTVNKKDSKITVTSEDASKPYDDVPLTNHNKTVTGETVAGDEVVVEFTGSQKFVGTSDNEFTVKVMRGSDVVTDNYTFGTHTFGKLTVTSAEQPLSIADQYVRVNGSILLSDLEQLVTGNEGNIDFAIKSGTALTYDAINEEYVAGATAGDVVMTVTAAKMDLGGDTTPEWKETTKDFTIHVVNKENVTISGLEDNQVFTFDNTTKTPWGTGTITVEDNKVDVDELEIFYNGTTGSTTYSSKFAPVDAGTYTITYKVPDSNPNYVGSVTYTFTIKKAQLEKVTLVENTFEYTGDEIVSDGSNFDSNKMNVSGDIKATNVGNYSITVSLKDKDNYEWKDGTTTDLVLNWSITQATPDYTVPTGLTGVKGQTLNDITLPGRFTWNDASTVLTAGTNKYKATYTPEDTTNYKKITDIDIEVVVKNKFDVITSVPGGNGTITPSKLDVVEGTKVEITFTPNTGYMIDKVLVNTVETTVIGNKIELTVDEEKDVAVSYKKIPFTVTVKDVDGATITPNGVVAVNYGEDKEFTITANSGYKLVKVLVDGTDKTADMVGDTLKLTNITSNIKLEVVVEKIVYEVTEGANQKYTITKNNEAKFKINADFRLFDDGKVYVDNELVDPKNYTAESGSTIITLKKEFVDTLSVGEHTLKVLFNDGGEAITTFNVAREMVPTANPQTGDNIGFYIISGILSIVGLAGAGIFYKRKQTN